MTITFYCLFISGRKVSMSSEKASMELLWQFSAEDMANRRINSIAFCRTSPVSMC